MCFVTLSKRGGNTLTNFPASGPGDLSRHAYPGVDMMAGLSPEARGAGFYGSKSSVGVGVWVWLLLFYSRGLQCLYTRTHVYTVTP